MHTSDQTLKQFLAQFNVGTPQAFTDKQLENVGCPKEESPDHEVIQFELSRTFEPGELVALATSYLLRLKYKEVHIAQLNVDMPPDEDSYYQSMITAENSGEDRMMITVDYNDSRARFIKSI
jgi:hypothetical protein